ncbi:RimJ/RimL family protein N-acetyltransferase [Kribbella aluminosa]|uniref:RimJ/RimL family protein N-acetyltransferase n=1 Tax=Kribbella aluminosa TaxID=416017 RepID=A0ABS4UL33_9ACTN|nr:GNAT family N-acetyltransferase [Kribbella aluminosa]MBP2352319.1 RimJ/RimL family protein N-acetyltransferase [Kribbella aluminosa]
MPLLVDPALARGVLREIAQPRLVSDGLTLRPWRRSDAAAVWTAFDCPDIQRWHVRGLDSLDEAGDWVTQWADRWDDETAASWAVVDGDDQPLGQVGLRNISLAEGSASLSYWVTPDARGRAVAARSVDALSAWAFGPIGFNRLNVHHSTANTASCRVAERTGFRLEGTLRQAIKHADGWHDWHLHGRLHTDS